VNVTRGNEDGKNASWGDISTVWVDARDGVGGSQHGSQQVATTNLYSLVVARRFASRRQSHPYLPMSGCPQAIGEIIYMPAF
jgi:hypothetical protein